MLTVVCNMALAAMEQVTVCRDFAAVCVRQGCVEAALCRAFSASENITHLISFQT